MKRGSGFLSTPCPYLHRIVQQETRHINQHRYSPRDNLAALQRPPEVLLDVVVRDVVTEFLLHAHLPSQDFLVCETVYPSEYNAGRFRRQVPTREADQRAHTDPRHTTGRGPTAWSQRDLGKVLECSLHECSIPLTRGMSRSIAALVVTMNCDVETQVLR